MLVDGLCEVLVQIVDEHAGIVGLEVTAIVGDYPAVFEGDDVTADGEVVGTHLVADGGCFQGTAAFVDFVQVIAEDSGVGYF